MRAIVFDTFENPDVLSLQDVACPELLVRPERTRLLALGTLVASGRLHPIIEQVLPLEEAAQAQRRLETGHGQGKIVLAVREEKGKFALNMLGSAHTVQNVVMRFS